MTESGAPAVLQPDQNEHALRVSVANFDGPLDLLLHLVKEKQLDIATVPLALVAEQFLEYVSMMQAIDVEAAAEYLVIAATLVFLKSRALLPPIPAEFLEEGESPEEVEERLRQRLIAYSKYRDVGEDLRQRQFEASSYFFRDMGDPHSELRQKYRVDPNRLTHAFLTMLQNARPEKRTIARERLTLVASMDYIVRRVREQREVLFSTICKELGMTRESIVVAFLAILELVRRRRLAFDQKAPFDDIRLFLVAKS